MARLAETCRHEYRIFEKIKYLFLIEGLYQFKKLFFSNITYFNNYFSIIFSPVHMAYRQSLLLRFPRNILVQSILVSELYNFGFWTIKCWFLCYTILVFELYNLVSELYNCVFWIIQFWFLSYTILVSELYNFVFWVIQVCFLSYTILVSELYNFGFSGI